MGIAARSLGWDFKYILEKYDGWKYDRESWQQEYQGFARLSLLQMEDFLKKAKFEAWKCFYSNIIIVYIYIYIYIYIYTKDADQRCQVERHIEDAFDSRQTTINHCFRSRCWFHGRRKTLEARERPTTTTLLTWVASFFEDQHEAIPRWSPIQL